MSVNKFGVTLLKIEIHVAEVIEHSVLPQNTQLLAEAYQAAGQPYSCHIFPGGSHGHPQEPDDSAHQWRALAQNWYQSLYHL